MKIPQWLIYAERLRLYLPYPPYIYGTTLMAHSHCKGTGPGPGRRPSGKYQYHLEMFRLVQDRDRDQDSFMSLFPIVPFLFPVLVQILRVHSHWAFAKAKKKFVFDVYRQSDYAALDWSKTRLLAMSLPLSVWESLNVNCAFERIHIAIALLLLYLRFLVHKVVGIFLLDQTHFCYNTFHHLEMKIVPK